MKISSSRQEMLSISPADLRPLPAAFEPDELVANSRFSECLSKSASALLAIHRRLPREVRYVADIQKWLLSQTTLALHFEHANDPQNPPISPTNLLNLLRGLPIASKNTALAFLQEMRHYKMVEEIPSSDRRRHLFKATIETEQLIGLWVLTHMEALDAIDDGFRAELMQMQPELLNHVQPLMTRQLIQNPAWYDPPESIAIFTQADSGTSIIHDLATRAPWELSGEVIWIGPATSHSIAAQYVVSQSHTARILARSRIAGLIGWELPRSRGNCWVSANLVQDYRYWQALKFSALSKALFQAVRLLKK